MDKTDITFALACLVVLAICFSIICFGIATPANGTAATITITDERPNQ